jgi:thioredoxin-like negative regulator of GroEL
LQRISWRSRLAKAGIYALSWALISAASQQGGTASGAGSAAWAEPTVVSFEQATADFDQGRYARALGQFQLLCAQNPDDAVALYYVALCHHNLNDSPAAASEYLRVLAQTSDPELIRRAQAGMQAIAQGVGGNFSLSRQSAEPAAFTTSVAAASVPQAPASAKQLSAAPLPVVIELYTTWCPYCTKFAPLFAQAARDFNGRLICKSLNAEDEGNRRLVKKFKVTAFPTILFLDGQGNLIEKLQGAPQTLPDFESRVNDFLAKASQPAG